MGKKIIITESERLEIRKLYGLLDEQSTTGETKNPEITLDLAGTFGSGKYLIPGKVEKLEDIINQIREFKKQNQGSVIEITINSGESQVPNYDREKFQTKGDYRPEAKLPVGELAKFRSESLKKYLETNAADLIKDSKIVISEPVIGQTKWNPDGGDKPEDEKFTKEQFANFKIKAIGKVPDDTGGGGDENCATGLKIKVYVPGHQCNNSEFFIVLNTTVLYNKNGGYTANLNNAATTLSVGGFEMAPQLLNPGYGYISKQYRENKDGDIGGSRVDEFVVTEEQSKSIVKAGNGFIYVWMISTRKSAHRDIPRVFITKGTEVVYDKQPGVSKGLLLVLDACGNKVVETPATPMQEPDVTSWVQKLVDERKKIKLNEKLPKIVDSKDVLLQDADELKTLIGDIEYRFATSADTKAEFVQSWKAERANKNNSIIRTYAEIMAILKRRNWLRKNPLSAGKYDDKFVMSNMGGDIRMDLDEFYPIFNAFYLDTNSKQYLPKGLGTDAVLKNLRDLGYNF